MSGITATDESHERENQIPDRIQLYQQKKNNFCSSPTMSGITATDESHEREDQIQIIKYSEPEISTKGSKTTPRKPHLTKIKYILPDATQFSSLVQQLTGCGDPQNNRGECSISYENLRERNIKSYYYDMLQLCMNLTQKGPCPSQRNLGNNSINCLDCLAYCTLFPKGYEIEGDTIVQLWMAAGLIYEEPMEEIGDAYLRALCKFEQIISFSTEDYSTGKTWFQVNDSELSEKIRHMSSNTLLTLDDADHKPPVIPKQGPCHVALQSLPTNHSLEKLGAFAQMRAIMFLRDHNSNMDSLPYDFFMTMKFLQALDLRGTKVSELPSSMENAKALCYLDLSDTPIKRLPESIDSLQNLQTLKLQNCHRLIALPKATRRLASLRHLHLGNTCRLHSMPPGIGALTSLRTLSNFIVGQDPQCQLMELSNLNHLKGKLRISELENVASTDQVGWANLSSKQHLIKLELQWSDDDREHESIEDDVEDKILEHLRPNTNLQDLRILCYGGLKFPSWMSNPCYNKLRSITLFKCENCQVLPSLGKLPELLSLSLIELVGVKTIDFRLCRDVFSAEEDQFFAFAKLQTLVIKSMDKLTTWKDMGEHDFARLTMLTIKDCHQLGDLCRLSNFCSLEHMEINHCENLSGFSKGGLPKSLKTVLVESCPSLSLSCLMKEAKDWHKMEQSSTLMIYQRDEYRGE